MHGDAGVRQPRLERLVTGAWTCLYRCSPLLVGGCRPVCVAGYLATDKWRVEHREAISAFGVASEVLVARKRTDVADEMVRPGNKVTGR